MAVIAIDFDNTLVNGDKSLPGAREAINILREEGNKVVINSCNNTSWIKKVLDNLDIRYDLIYGSEHGNKVLADLYIDDKGYHFPYNGDWTAELPKVLDRVKGLDNRKW